MSVELPASTRDKEESIMIVKRPTITARLWADRRKAQTSVGLGGIAAADIRHLADHVGSSISQLLERGEAAYGAL